MFVIGMLILILTATLSLIYNIDKHCWRNQRILKNDWEFDKGYYIAGVICGKCSSISYDTLYLNKEHKAVIKHQYFHTLVIKDVITQKETSFTAIGSYRWK